MLCLSLIISLFNPFDLYPVSSEIYVLLGVGFSSFFIGLIGDKHNNIRAYSNPYGIYSYQDKFRLFFKSKFFCVLYILCFLVIIYLVATQWRLLLVQGGAGNLKLDIFELIFNNNSALYAFYRMIVFPFFYLSCVMFLVYVLNKGNRIVTVFLFAFIVLFAFIGGKKGYFATIIEYFVVVFFLVKFKEIKWNAAKRIKYFSIAGVVIGFLFLGAAYMASLSGGIEGSKDDLKESSMSNLNNLITYNIGPFRAFEYGLKNDYLGQSGGYSLGRNFIGGAVDYYGSAILQKVGIPIKRVQDGGMSLMQENRIYIGKDNTFNFSYTALMYFYLDFGVLGIIILPFVFGRFCLLTLRVFNRHRTVGSLCLVSFLIIQCLMFGATWFFAGLSAQPTMLFFYLMHRYELKKNRAYLRNFSLRQAL